MTRLIPFAVLIAIAGLSNQPVVAQTKKLPTTAEVLAKLKQKRESGGIQVYKMEFEITFLQKEAATIGREVRELVFDWRTTRYRETGLKSWGSKPYEITEVFNGERIKTRFRDTTKEGKPIGDGAWKYGILTGRPNSWGFQTEWWPVFFHKGAIAGLHERFFPSHFVFDPDADQFFVDGEVTLNGRKCISLKTLPETSGNPAQSMQYEYVIAPEMDYSVVGFTYYKQDVAIYSLDIDVDAAGQPGRWAPRGWTFTVFGGGGRTEHTIKVKVTNFDEKMKLRETNPFDIIPPEGAKVGRSHHVTTRDREGRWDFKLIPFKYEVKNSKLIQIEGPPVTPEWWVTDHWRSVVRRTLIPAVLLAVPRRTVLRNSPGNGK